MKLRFKHQTFQKDAARAVVDVFYGQKCHATSYLIDKGLSRQPSLTDTVDFTGYCNHAIETDLTDDIILHNIQTIQRANLIKPSDKLEGHYNLTIEMETGTGKTYTYIKTMYELYKAYGWCKFIIVVPSIAIREGVYKTFQMTEDHFASEYGKKIRYFIYNSSQLTMIDRFASDNSICAMIINSQAFNARGKDARRIYMELDEFRSRRPIDVLAKTHPILIIDEPQSVEGKQTRENLKQFQPLLTLRYSATHKSDSIYNMVYRLDAMEAYNKHLVKKIAVKGISESGTTATEGYAYLESINLSKAAPTATLQFDCKGKSGISKVSRIVTEGYNLYDHSGHMEEYKQGFVVSRIDGRDDSVEFVNGIKIHAGDVIGKVNEEDLRRIQIRETILSHIDMERKLFSRGIKVLSLFFIDEVAKYRLYDAAGQPANGVYAQMFEEEYKDITGSLEIHFGEEDYLDYLNAIPADKTHAGYFSVDKKGRMIDSKVARKETTTDDVDAYELIMKKKELLLDCDPVRSPVRFIFSHSALREGWDNPNVFQICTLKQSSSTVRKRQEVGRGLRLCVNSKGDRMDMSVLGNDVQNVNVLTVIASESYDSFARGLQSELAEAVAYRPCKVTAELFEERTVVIEVMAEQDGQNGQNEESGKDGQEQQATKKVEHVIDAATAREIVEELREIGYIDSKGSLTDKYYQDKNDKKITAAKHFPGTAGDMVLILDSVYDGRWRPVNSRKNNVELTVDKNKLAMPAFRELWDKINARTVYTVNFDTNELIRHAIDSLDTHLRVTQSFFNVTTGKMKEISSKEQLESGDSFVVNETESYRQAIMPGANVRYDLVGKLVEETRLTRKAIISILTGIRPSVFEQFKDNPEEFILRAASLINAEKATAIIQHITYDLTNDHYDTNIFTEPTIRGRLDVNAMKADKHLYDHVVYDSGTEKKFATDLEHNKDVVVYVKLPDGFYISTPVGRYNPDWAIAWKNEDKKHIYFVAETKGSLDSLQLRQIEDSKIHCAREHFRAISSGDVIYDVVTSFQGLLDLVKW